MKSLQREASRTRASKRTTLASIGELVAFSVLAMTHYSMLALELISDLASEHEDAVYGLIGLLMGGVGFAASFFHASRGVAVVGLAAGTVVCWLFMSPDGVAVLSEPLNAATLTVSFAGTMVLVGRQDRRQNLRQLLQAQSERRTDVKQVGVEESDMSSYRSSGLPDVVPWLAVLASVAWLLAPFITVWMRQMRAGGTRTDYNLVALLAGLVIALFATVAVAVEPLRGVRDTPARPTARRMLLALLSLVLGGSLLVLANMIAPGSEVPS